MKKMPLLGIKKKFKTRKKMIKLEVGWKEKAVYDF
jgi:hypothetical protein